MGLGKYTREERLIVKRISDFQTRKQYHFIKWNDLEIKIKALAFQIKGKYKPKK